MELVKFDKYLIVSYEDLLSNTTDELSRILDYLNITKDFVENMVLSNKKHLKLVLKEFLEKVKQILIKPSLAIRNYCILKKD